MVVLSQHLTNVNQTYLSHFHDAIHFSSQSFLASVCLLVHAVFPDVFPRAGSCIISNLYEKLLAKSCPVYSEKES